MPCSFRCASAPTSVPTWSTSWSRSFPGVPTVALVTHHDAKASETLLRLGATGVRQVVDVTAPAGWSRLRQVVAEPASRGAARILAPVFAALPVLAPDARVFLEVLVRLAPEAPAVRSLASRLEIKPSTLMSRFSRSGLPSPKTYLAAVRLLYASQYFEGAAARWPTWPTGSTARRLRALGERFGPCWGSRRASFAGDFPSRRR